MENAGTAAVTPGCLYRRYFTGLITIIGEN